MAGRIFALQPGKRGVPCSGSVEFQPADHQGIPHDKFFGKDMQCILRTYTRATKLRLELEMWLLFFTNPSEEENKELHFCYDIKSGGLPRWH